MARKAQTSSVSWHIPSLVSRSEYEGAITSTVSTDDDLVLDQERFVCAHIDCCCKEHHSWFCAAITIDHLDLSHCPSISIVSN